MTFRFVSEGRSVPVTVVDARPGATVRDLAVALARLGGGRHLGDAGPVAAPGTAGWSCACDGVPSPGDLPLRAWVVPKGSTVTLVGADPVAGPGAVARSGPTDEEPEESGPPEPGLAEVRVVAGADSGARATVGSGGLIIGRRDPAAEHDDPPTGAALLLGDPTVSVRHAEVRVDQGGTTGGALVRDLDSRNGTWVLGRSLTEPTSVPVPTRIRVGATVLELCAAPHGGTVSTPAPQALGAAPLPGEWATPFHRPPQPPTSPPLAPLEVPVLPEPVPEVAPPGLATLLVPLALAGAMVLALHSLLWGLFALAGPLLLLGGFWDQRRRGRSRRRHAARRHLRDVARFDVALAEATRREADRRRAAAPDLATVLRTGGLPTGALWRRRANVDDPLRLRIGLGDLTWEPPLDRDGNARDAATGGRADDAPDRVLLRDVPIEVGLGEDAVVGIVGPRPHARRLARALVVRACTERGPSDLALVVAADDAPWDWTRWLPHRRADASADGVPVLRCVEVDERRRDLPWDAGWTGPAPAAARSCSRRTWTCSPLRSLRSSSSPTPTEPRC